jgi:ribonuclease HI
MTARREFSSDGDDPQVAEALAAERETLSPACRADANRLRRFLAPDFHEFGASGAEVWFEGTAERVAAYTDPDGEPIRAEGMRGARLADGLVMVKYTARINSRWSHRTSLWRRAKPGCWQMFHHQGTPTERP